MSVSWEEAVEKSHKALRLRALAGQFRFAASILRGAAEEARELNDVGSEGVGDTIAPEALRLAEEAERETMEHVAAYESRLGRVF